MLYGDGLEPQCFSFFTAVKISTTIKSLINLNVFYLKGPLGFTAWLDEEPFGAIRQNCCLRFPPKGRKKEGTGWL